ncbi:unnamed protein product [Caenorhabditis auriculariae]|uniref:BOS complex subunit NCLN n=1 Tax=Caenorhabditis auriculariae TaxID=2777116 RepID=A0A8S1GS63_9PELO|nr:unnamed protein product [Caenorhabditis auriculariae]
MQEEILDVLRNPFIVFSLSFLLTVCVVSGSHQLGDAVDLEFQAYRLQQYEISGNMYGSYNYRLQYEAVSLNSKALRRCFVATWREVARRDLDELLSLSSGALLIFIPSDLDVLTEADRKLFIDLETRLRRTKTDLAVYVAPTSSEGPAVLADIEATSSVESTATQQLVRSVAANTIQFTSSDTQTGDAITYKPNNIVGRLNSGERSAPTIAFVAHYDSHAVFPGIANGSDSNGSGIVALLELLAVFSKFYEKPSTRPPYNLVFIWTAAGKYNYQGARQWIEDYQKGTEDEKLEIALCIEGIGSNGDLKMHTSKQPSENSVAARILRRLRSVSPNKTVDLVTKKISLTAVNSWEHEKFNIKRLPAVTISSFGSPTDSLRNSVLDGPSNINLDDLMANIRTIAEAVLGHMLSLPEGGVSGDVRVTSETTMLSRDAVDRQRVHHFVRQFASKPRPVGDKVATESASANIAVAASSYAQVSVSQVTFSDVKVYGGVANKVVAERVKPAVFELVIAAGVSAYLYAFYFTATHAQRFVEGAVHKIKKSL